MLQNVTNYIAPVQPHQQRGSCAQQPVQYYYQCPCSQAEPGTIIKRLVVYINTPHLILRLFSRTKMSERN